VENKFLVKVYLYYYIKIMLPYQFAFCNPQNLSYNKILFNYISYQNKLYV